MSPKFLHHVNVFSRIVKASYSSNSFRRYLSSNVKYNIITLPSLSPTMASGKISKWNKNPGEKLKAGDVLCEVETDKAVVSFDVQDDFVLAKILSPASDNDLDVGTPIAISIDDIKDLAEFNKIPESEYTKTTSSQQKTSTAPTSSTPATDTHATKAVNKDLLTPAARHIAESQSIDLSGVVGTGKGGRINKGDVLTVLKKGGAQPVAKAPAATPASAPAASPSPSAQTISKTSVVSATESSNFVDVNNSNMRKVIAKRLAESKQTVPHFYTTIECELDDLLGLRKVLKNSFSVNVSVNDIVIKAVALALRDVPQANAKWNPAASSIQSNSSIDISVAVATPSGLITPIVANADKLGLVDINTKVKDLATRAKDNKLKPEEYQGGTFTISNLGMFGISNFSAVINPPQSCILAVSSGIERVMPPKEGGSEPRIGTTLSVQLSGDRRVIDEPTAALFLQAFRKYVNNPQAILL